MPPDIRHAYLISSCKIRARRREGKVLHDDGGELGRGARLSSFFGPRLLGFDRRPFHIKKPGGRVEATGFPVQSVDGASEIWRECRGPRGLRVCGRVASSL